MDTALYIPTLDRVDKQITMRSIVGTTWEPYTWLVTGVESQAEALRQQGFQVLLSPVEGIGAKRQWILDQHPGRKVLMSDDDFRFTARMVDQPTRYFVTYEPAHIERMFTRLESMLDQVAMAGVTGKGLANTLPYPTATGRIHGVLGFRKDILAEQSIRMDDFPFMEDFAVNLSLLSQGYPTAKLTTHAYVEGPSNAPGGCSGSRTPNRQRAAALGLFEAFPEYVTIVRRNVPNWHGGERLDVRVQWAKALKQGRARRDLLGLPPIPEPDWTGLAPEWDSMELL